MDLGTIITIGAQTLGFICVGVYIYTNMKRDIGLIKTDVSKIQGIEEYIKTLSVYLKDGDFSGIPSNLKNYESKSSPYYTANSPLRLNDRGMELIRESGFDTIIEEYKPNLVGEIERKVKDVDENKKLYYIEKESLSLIRELDAENDKIMEGVGLYIFKNGLLDDKNQILNALGIYLRDKVIEELGLNEKIEKLFKKDKNN
ncbi:hypothetical protein BKN14_00495 [Candidatus Gracilibacteria bacterium HOT-871]|nr:hypothetical protein BKN14_00495 [Candidatus Gracilibacteria bacterium HOT-871]